MEVADTEVFGSHDRRQDASRVGLLVRSHSSRLGILVWLLIHMSWNRRVLGRLSAHMDILTIGSVLLFITRDKDAIVKVTLIVLALTVTRSVVPVVLFGVCVGVLKAESVGLN